MYNKIKKCLDSMAIEYRECRWIDTIDQVYLSTGFKIWSNYEYKYYVEVKDREINIWEIGEKTKLINYITVNSFYKAMFQLGMLLGRACK